MEDRKIFNTDQVSWYEDDDNRLDYQVAFEDDEFREESPAQVEKEEIQEKTFTPEELQARLDEKDKHWKDRLKKTRKVAFEKGLKKGRQQGYQQAEEDFKEKEGKLMAMFEQVHEEWHQRHEALNPGLLDLVFDIVEQIVGIPVENPQMREKLEEELSGLLHSADNQVKPIVRVCEKDYQFVENLVEKYAPEVTMNIQTSEHCNPGEFEFETDKKMVVYRFKELLKDFRENLSLPSWK